MRRRQGNEGIVEPLVRGPASSFALAGQLDDHHRYGRIGTPVAVERPAVMKYSRGVRNATDAARSRGPRCQRPPGSAQPDHAT
jgi:hypothetical protein